MLFVAKTSGHTENNLDAETWTTLIERGGLYYIKDCTFTLCMELALRQFLNLKRLLLNGQLEKQLIMQTISEDPEVLHQWNTLTENSHDSVVDYMLHIIINEFMTLRGYYFRKSIL